MRPAQLLALALHQTVTRHDRNAAETEPGFRCGCGDCQIAEAALEKAKDLIAAQPDLASKCRAFAAAWRAETTPHLESSSEANVLMRCARELEAALDRTGAAPAGAGSRRSSAQEVQE
jgi:hypothetical protein